jgi:glycogen operon protein
VGGFPPGWSEWNGRYRDIVRSYWKGDGGLVGEVASRLSGSSDVFAHGGRSPRSSINFVTAHDGFTMRDLVSYNTKHNEANGEGNRDGTDDNQSWNCGVEGETDDPNVKALRARQVRNFLATLLLSQGTPMICGGDEIGRTQRGNNNAYCQDDEISWYDWDLDDERRALLDFTRRVIALRRDHPALHRAKFFRGRRIRGTDVRDIMWYRHDGLEMTDEDWSNPVTATLGLFLAGQGIDDFDPDGNLVVDDDFSLLVNGSEIELDFVLPRAATPGPWQLLVVTSDDRANRRVDQGGRARLLPRSLALFIHYWR